MNPRLPDVAAHDSPDFAMPLDWVGMDGIDLPIRLGGVCMPVTVDVAVDLPRADIKGIHMSRLHRLLNDFSDAQSFEPGTLRALLHALVDSHRDCGTTAARTTWRFKLLRARPALVTPGLSGWQAYPVTLVAGWHEHAMSLQLSVDVTYSSTCPCSAALSRQVLQDAFIRDFGAAAGVLPHEVAAWLARNGSLATPHSQRSVAQVTVTIDAEDTDSTSPAVDLGDPGVAMQAVGGAAAAATAIATAIAAINDPLGIVALIDRVEAALGTAVQTAVKRADEQAFAQRNGQNLMYVEDATRRILTALAGRYRELRIAVRHLESLHPHDAVASGSLPVR